MTYDRVDYDLGTPGVDENNIGVHIGMFLAWCVNRGLEGEFHQQESTELLAQLGAREITGREFLMEACDGKFWEEDLSETGNRFAAAYYSSSYEKDYRQTFGLHGASLHEVVDTWSNYEKIATVLDERFEQWQQGKSAAEKPVAPKPRWKFWQRND